MPTYEYVCESCGHDLEVFQRMSEDPLQQCPSCETPALKRKIGLGAGIIFKGGGFYETDFKDRKGGSGSSSTGKKESEKTAKKESSTDKGTGSSD